MSLKGELKEGYNLALIPARSGSTRVKNKNLRLLGGKPLIAHTISCALKSRLIDRVIVSTDSPQIAKVAKNFGAEVPFLRPKEISGPAATEYEFHDHVVKWIKRNEKHSPALIVNLYPTAPFRRPESIDRAIRMMQRTARADSLRSVRICSEHPYKMWIETKAKTFIEPFVRGGSTGSQTLSYQLLPKVFIQNANIYVTRPRTLELFGSTVGKKVLKFEMSEEESIDINTPQDIEYAVFLFESLRGGKHSAA